MGDDFIFNYRKKDSVRFESRAVELTVLCTLKHTYFYFLSLIWEYSISAYVLQIFEGILPVSSRDLETPTSRKQMQKLDC